MAGSEGSVTGQTELLSGWSCVVHRPSEDPEPSSLPSTVDIAAFSSGPSVALSHSPQDDYCSNSDSETGSDSENSVSDPSGSCSYSSSDSDSSTSSQVSSASSVPAQFSVTSSQTGGLRLTIATVRKDEPVKAEDTNSINSVIKNLAVPKLSSSDSDSDSDCSDSSTGSERSRRSRKISAPPATATTTRNSKSAAPPKKVQNSAVTKVTKIDNKTHTNSATNSKKAVQKDAKTNAKVPPPKTRGRPPTRTNKMASLPMPRTSSPRNASSSDSEASDTNSVMLESCSLQEIRQEDLAAILPDQQDCDAFGGFECEARAEKTEAVDVGDASGSDMELPTQLVNAAIQRVTESSSETESQPAAYASSLLQQFVQQAQLLNTGVSGPSNLNATDAIDKQNSSSGNHSGSSEIQANDNKNNETVKRKRGRPKKNLNKKTANNAKSNSSNTNSKSTEGNTILNAEYCVEPNVSPDSGIQNSPDHLSSPVPSPSPVKTKTVQENGKSKSSINNKPKTKNANKHMEVLKSEKMLSHKTTTKIEKLVQKQKIAVTCNNLDRVLYANTDRVLYPPRRKVGRPAGKVVRKPGRPPKHRHPVLTENVQKTPKTDADKSASINSRYKTNHEKVTNVATKSDSKKVQNHNKIAVQKTAAACKSGDTTATRKVKKSTKLSNNDSDIVQLTSNTLSLSLVGGKADVKKGDINSDVSVNTVPKKIKSSGALLNEICERVSKRLELNKVGGEQTQKTEKTVLQSATTNANHTNIVTKKPVNKKQSIINKKPKLNAFKSKLTTFKHMKVMHTKHKYKKHKKHKIKILKTIATPSAIQKVDTDIDKLILDFVKYCTLGTNKSQKENLPEMFRCVKKLSKKRKGVEQAEGRKKKKQTNTNSGENKETNSNEQRLPLKKRHYHNNISTETNNSNSKDDTSTISKIIPDIKTNPKNGVINNNKNTTDKTKNLVISSKEQNNSTELKDMQSNKSPAQNLPPKSVLVMNKSQTNTISKTNTNNNNVYNKKNLDSEDLIGVHIDEAIEACITRYTSNPIKISNNIAKQTSEIPETEIKKPISTSTITATTPKKRHRLEAENISSNTNNNQLEKATKKLDSALNNTKTIDNAILTEHKTNTLESVVTEIKNKKNLIAQAEKKYNDKKIETVAQMITRKKNRLEDLASNLVSKISTSVESKLKKSDESEPTEQTTRASVIKSPIAKKIKPSDNDKLLDSIVDEKPTGIFMPSIDLELHIPATTIQTVQGTTKNEKNDSSSKSVPTTDKILENNQHNLRNKKSAEIIESEQTETKVSTNNVSAVISNSVQSSKPNNKKSKLAKDVVVQVEKLKQTETAIATNHSSDNKTKSVIQVKKKVRRRKAINRTGFPTLKKKKKKIIPINKTSIPSITKTEPAETLSKITENNIYDRIPRIDEEATTFMKRTQQNCVLSVIALEKLQAKPETTINSADSEISKWELSSECDSLPLDECTITSELESIKSIKSERSSSRLDNIKQEKMHLRLRDVSPATSIETKSSDRVKNKRGNRDRTPDVKDETRMRTRDSSAGSISINDDFDKKMKRKRESSCEIIERKFRKIDDYHSASSSFKRRLRDLSPASSIEPLPFDKKQRSESVASSSGDDMKRSKKIPRWRKKFLVAGLFSDYYKEDDESARARRESTSNKTRLVYNPEEHPYGLLPPPYHCGKYLRCRKVPFQLPYDLWWQHMHNQLPGRDLVPSWNYKKIRTNVYCVRMPTGACEPQACNCSVSSGCEDDCINRLVLAECPSTHRCRNQRIQKHEWSPGIEKFMTISKMQHDIEDFMVLAKIFNLTGEEIDDIGWGVRTKLPIRQGEFILEYVGEVVSDQEFKQRMATRYVHDTHHYCLHLDGGLVIDGHRMGGDGRFVNHSCEPNCEMQKWSVNGQFRMALFALRDIRGGEELTYDYNFSLFNPAEGQVCKCGSIHCRGVIGGKSQRVRQSILPSRSNDNSSLENGNGHSQVGRVGRPRKNQARRSTTNSGPSEKNCTAGSAQTLPTPVIVTPQIKPMSHQQKCFVLQHHCFLLRNLDKVKRLRERSLSSVSRNQPHINNAAENSSAFMSQLNALRQPRNMRTRRLAQAQDNPELNKAARLATILKDLFEFVTNAKDENKSILCTPFLNLPSKRKLPEYYTRIIEPIDLNTIEQNIATGIYRTVELFDTDMNKLFANAVKFFGRTSELGIAATRLKKVYGKSKLDYLSRLEDVIGEKVPLTFIGGKNPGDEEEDVIRCICGLYRDEGLMIQCERCLVWQHCECVRADPSAASYHCERCVHREVDLEIPLDEYTEHGHRYYVSLMRGNLQLRQGDTVYVLRDIPIKGTDKKHTYETVGDVQYTDLDIFRIERLWKDSKTGQRIAFGHHYLRPHETYHEPTRKFFPNEVMRVPLYEVVPIELIMSPCWVLDLNTYCKGRPIGASEEHVYICEYRVDKTARLFSKISKSKFPVCSKSYAFERFEQRLKISRTYTPHELDNFQVKPRGRKPHEGGDETKIDIKHDKNHDVLQQIQEHVPIIRVRSREEQRAHLNSILLRLLGRMPTKQTLDVSYLLEGGRRRKKQQS